MCFDEGPPNFPMENNMRARSFVFTPFLLALTLFVPNMAQADSSATLLIQPAFAFSEDPVEYPVEDPAEYPAEGFVEQAVMEQTSLIQPAFAFSEGFGEGFAEQAVMEQASLVQPAFAFSEGPIDGLAEGAVEQQIGKIRIVNDNIILSSLNMEPENGLGEDSFVDKSLISPKPLRYAPVSEPGEYGPYPCACGACESYDTGCGCVTNHFGTPSCFDRWTSPCNKRDPFFIDGWVSAGATLPSRSPNAQVEALSRFPDVYDKFLMNQLYFAVGRNVDKSGNAFDIGGRLDLLYGSDYYFTSALGLETRTTAPWGGPIWNLDPKNAAAKWNSSDGQRNAGNAALYGISMPQLYGEFFAPLGLGTTVKAGHFYSMMGHESPMSPENFFYSHTWSMTHGQPMTLTGVVVNQQLTRRLTGIIGYTNGWDIWDSPRGCTSIITGFKWSNPDRNSELAFTIHTGNAQVIGDGQRTNYSLVYKKQLTHRLQWVIQHDLGVGKNTNFVGTMDISNIPWVIDFVPVDGQWASITNYLYYTLNEKWSAGGRFEWFQDTNNTRIGNFYPHQFIVTPPVAGSSMWMTGQNYYNITLGLNWKPIPRMTLRPEVRWDWSDVERHHTIPANTTLPMFNHFRNNNQFTVALEGYIKF